MRMAKDLEGKPYEELRSLGLFSMEETAVHQPLLVFFSNKGWTEQVEHFVPIFWGKDEVTNLLSKVITYLFSEEPLPDKSN